MYKNDPEIISEQIQRIKLKVQTQNVLLYPVLSEEEIQQFEIKRKIKLPLNFREFLKVIGNGGSGPPLDNMLQLGSIPENMNEWEKENWSSLKNIFKPFPFINKWPWEEQGWQEILHTNYESITYGNICLGSHTWNSRWHLVITGPERGNMWFVYEDGLVPCKNYADFLSWYEVWLDTRTRQPDYFD